MRLLLIEPTDDACLALEKLLTDPYYYSDASEDGDVCYTSNEPDVSAIKDWARQAREDGLIKMFVELLDGE